MKLFKQQEELLSGSVICAPESENDFRTHHVRNENTPQPAAEIFAGICINCDNLGDCMWQQNNNINCQHFK